MCYGNPRSLYPVLKSAKEKLKKAKAASASEEEADPAAPSVPKPAGTPRKRKTASEKPSASTPTKGAKRGKKAPAPRPQGASGEDPVVLYDEDDLEDGEA